MKFKFVFSMILIGLMAACTPNKPETDNFSYTDEKFADIQMLRYKVEGFEQLSLKQKTLIYYLQEAA